MDSGNSGSLQSSSGAEEECDSRAARHHQPHPPPPSFNHPLFDQNQMSNPFFFTPSPQHQLLNLDSAVWSKTLPSFSDNHLFPTVPFSPATAVTATEPLTSTNPPPARNPKKRSRASRRAPTTVLTTDTTNFRAMVQEFTGIPAPPFPSSSPAFPTSFDLFGRPSTMMRSNLPQLPPYLLRPYPQRLPSSQSSSSSISSVLDSMQNTISFPSNSHNQSSFLNPRTGQRAVSANGDIGQSQIHELHSTLPGLVSTANQDQVASGNWDGGGGDGSKESSGMKGDHGFNEPWICSSD